MTEPKKTGICFNLGNSLMSRAICLTNCMHQNL